MSYLIRRILAKPRLILDEMCRLYGKFASYLRRVLSKTRLIFPPINGPNVITTKRTKKKVHSCCFKLHRPYSISVNSPNGGELFWV